MATVGFVGLGLMGGGIAGRLLAAGHEVHGYNRTPEKARPLVAHGLALEESARAVAERVDVVFSMVSDTAALEGVARGRDGILAGLGPGKVYVDMTTASPSASRALAAEAAALGAAMLDAPVSGSVSTLAEGRLVILVGGDAGAYARVEPILRDIGHSVRHVGGNGDALLLKLALNVSVLVQMVAFSEGLLLAEAGGITRELAVETMLGSVIASPMLAYRGPFVLEPPEHAWFDCTMMQKDALLALGAAREARVALPTTAAANELLTAARATGLGDRDVAAVYDVLAAMAGMRGSGPPVEGAS